MSKGTSREVSLKSKEHNCSLLLLFVTGNGFLSV